MGKHLLIISCSKSKNTSEGEMPAMERYTGNCYKIIKKLIRDGKFPHNLDIIIISAQYGFLKPTDPIKNYELKMTKEQAEKLNLDIIQQFRALFENLNYDTININLGKEYRLAIIGLENVTPLNSKILHITGRTGNIKNSKMKERILSLNG